MSDFLEVCLPGDRRAYIEAGDIRRVLTAENSDEGDIGSPERPVTVLFRDGSELQIIGKSPLDILTWMLLASKRKAGPALKVTFLTSDLETIYADELPRG